MSFRKTAINFYINASVKTTEVKNKILTVLSGKEEGGFTLTIEQLVWLAVAVIIAAAVVAYNWQTLVNTVTTSMANKVTSAANLS